MVWARRRWISVCGCRWSPGVGFEKCLVEASQLPACASQIKAMTCVCASYSCSFQQHCSCSLRNIIGVLLGEKAQLRKLLLHLTLKAVLFLIWWGRNSYRSLPGFGVITFSHCSNLPSGVDFIVVLLSSKWRSCRGDPLVDLKRTCTKLKFQSEIHFINDAAL